MSEPTHLDRLKALRDLLTTTLSQAEERNIAPLSGRLQAILAEIASIERAAPKGNKVDELANRRKARRSDATGAGAPARAGKQQRKRSG